MSDYKFYIYSLILINADSKQLPTQIDGWVQSSSKYTLYRHLE